MNIGFFNNQIDERCTWQTYLYAKYARLLLGHSPVILYPAIAYSNRFPRPKWSRRLRNQMPWAKPKRPSFDQKMADRIRRDGIEISQVPLDADLGYLDGLYHAKSGENDGYLPGGTRYWVHAVFNASQPHGDRYAAVSQWLGALHSVPFVPHIVEVADDPQDLRKELGIPADAFVLGRFGGRDTFDVPWIWAAISDIVQQFDNVYFLFANTNVSIQHRRIISLPTIYDTEVSLEIQKRRFINTSNAMLHARIRGETFGIALGEFALCGKPVLTCGTSPERAHIQMLEHPLVYHNDTELNRWIRLGVEGQLPSESGGAYRHCTPEKVMAVFDREFLR